MNAHQQKKIEVWILKQFFVTWFSVFAIVGVLSFFIMSSVKVPENNTNTQSSFKTKPNTQQQQEKENQQEIDSYLLLLAA